MLNVVCVIVFSVSFALLLFFYTNNFSLEPQSTPVCVRESWAKDTGRWEYSLIIDKDKSSKEVREVPVKEAWMEKMIERRSIIDYFFQPSAKKMAIVIVLPRPEANNISLTYLSATGNKESTPRLLLDFAILSGDDWVHYAVIEPSSPTAISIQVTRSLPDKDDVVKVGELLLKKK